MKTYKELTLNPPELTIIENARQVIFTMVSCMCNNKSYITFNKGSDGDFDMWATLPSGMGYSISNYQLGHPKHNILWEADDQKWKEVINMLNNGTAQIEEVKSR